MRFQSDHLIIIISILAYLISCKSPKTKTPRRNMIDKLSLWNETPQKDKILSFVSEIVDVNAPSYVPSEDRIAVFDFDGTIACEKPYYMEVVVAMEQLCKLAKKDTLLLRDSLYIASCNKTYSYINTHTDEIILQAFLGYNQEVYLDSVSKTTSNSIDSRFDVTYSDLYYPPMLQLINYLKENDFDVYIVSGSEEGFIRSFGEDYLQMEREKIIGSTVSLEYYFMSNNISSFIRQKQYLSPMSEGAGKAELIRNRIGKQPIFAFGNSMGDFEMLTYSNSNPYKNLEMILIHDDPDEYIYYDAELEQKAKIYNWEYVNMSENFREIFSN